MSSRSVRWQYRFCAGGPSKIGRSIGEFTPIKSLILRWDFRDFVQSVQHFCILGYQKCCTVCTKSRKISKINEKTYARGDRDFYGSKFPYDRARFGGSPRTKSLLLYSRSRRRPVCRRWREKTFRSPVPSKRIPRITVVEQLPQIIIISVNGYSE